MRSMNHNLFSLYVKGLTILCMFAQKYHYILWNILLDNSKVEGDRFS